MPTDLTAVKDHLANLLMTAPDSSGSAQGIVSGAYLKIYEKEHNVTFAALDNDALEAVREEYKHFGEAEGDREYFGGSALADVIADLLGLDD